MMDATERKTAYEKLVEENRELRARLKDLATGAGKDSSAPQNAELEEHALRLILRHTPAIFWTTDPSFHFTYLAGSGLRLLGRRPQDLIGRRATEEMGGAVEAPAPSELLQYYESAAEGSPADFRMQIGGRVLVCHLESVPDSSGRCSGVLGISFDITEHMQAEANFRALAEHSLHGLLVLQGERVVFANQGASEYTGYSVRELTEMAVPQLGNLIHPDDWDMMLEYRRRRLDGRGAPATYETRMRHKDGEYRWQEMNVARIHFGGRPAFLLSFMDITERKKAADGILASERKYRRIFENVQDIFYEVKMDGTIVEVSPSIERFSSYRRDDLIGRNILDLYPDPSERDRLLEALRREHHVFDFEIHLSDGDGRVLPCSISASVQKALDNEAEDRIVGSMRVIEERKRAEHERRELENQMQQAQKMKSLNVMAGSIAHNFNNMLMTVLGNLGIALSEIDESAPERFSIEEAELAARRAAELSSQMLVYAGQGQGEMRVVALNQLIHNISGMLQINVSRNAILESHFSTENPQTLCDSAQMRQVVMNLVSNAAEAVGDRPGIIRVATGVSRCTRDELAKTVAGAALQAGEYAWFEVSDTGEGMDPETLGKVFDPFFTTRFTGRGLGLSTVLGIIRGHKGTIRVESAKGKGSTFRVLLPLAWESGEANAQSDDWRFWKGNGMILLVDDEEEVCRLCRRMLEKAGFEVITARDGHDAIELFKRRREDIVCVVLDLVMPRMDGEEALRGIRRVQKDIPVILSSGCNIDDIQSRFRPSELNGMVHKPYQYQELVTELRRVLGPCCAADR